MYRHSTHLTISLAAAAAISLSATAALADISTVEAFDNSTIQPNGPRTGASGDNFFNIEGSDNGNFASFGVADFDADSLFTADIASINSATLQLTQSNAGFSLSGPLSVYLTLNTTADINVNPDTSADDGALELNYIPGNNGAASVDTALQPLTLLGSGVYTVGNNGDVDGITLNDAAGLAVLQTAINAGGTLRFVITPDASDTAATYAGFGNSTFAGPTLQVDATLVPEPTSLALVGLGGLALLRRRRA